MTLKMSERKYFTTERMAIRLCLSLVLIYAVYTETGIWTAIFAFLACLGIEACVWTIKALRMRIDRLEQCWLKENGSVWPKESP